MMKRTSTEWDLSKLITLENHMNMNPSYQRDFVWNKKDKQKLLDSIYNDMYIPPIFLRKVADKNIPYEVIDGKQRLSSIFEFCSNKLPLRKEKSLPEHLFGKKYEQLDFADKETFISNRKMKIEIVEEATDVEIIEQFRRLQNGRHLNGAEKRNATVGEMRDVICELAKSGVFKNLPSIKNKRKKYEGVLAQVVCLELAGSEHAIPAGCQASNLDNMYDSNRVGFKGSKKHKRIQRVLNYISSCLKEETPEISNGYFISMYLLVSSLMDSFVLLGKEKDIIGFFKKIYLDCKVNQEKSDNDPSKDKELLSLTHNLTNACDNKNNITKRQIVIENRFFNMLNMVPLDDSRSFSKESDRIKLWNKSDKKCFHCREEISYDSMQIDHLKPYSKGGATSVENGAVCCAKCNQSKGNKDFIRREDGFELLGS